MPNRIVIVGAGIAGVSAAHRLAERHGAHEIVLIDEREPLSLTSDKGTWGYRNWWPGPDATMCRFVTRSIDLFEELAETSRDAFGLNRRGYLFVTGDETRVPVLRESARAVSEFGMGAVREHDGTQRASYRPAPPNEWRGQPDGADLLLGGEVVRRYFPFITRDAVAALHVRRAGTLDAASLGRWLLARSHVAGLRLLRDRVSAVRTDGGRVREVRLESGRTIGCDMIVLAPGPLLPEAGRMIGLDLPVRHELHGKLTLRDPVRAVPRDAPFTIWTDPVELSWSAEERADLGRAEQTRSLLEPFPGGVHVRPVDKDTGTEVYCIWTYDSRPLSYLWPPVFDPWYAEICVRGVARMVPALSAYFGKASDGLVDGGYYCKTTDNRPLIGPLPVEGAYALGALSGYGLMASQAAAELLVKHIHAEPLPDYAAALLPSRYDDPKYEALVAETAGSAGQL